MAKNIQLNKAKIFTSSKRECYGRRVHLFIRNKRMAGKIFAAVISIR